MKNLLIIMTLFLVSYTLTSCVEVVPATQKKPELLIHKKIAEVRLTERAGLERLLITKKQSRTDKALVAQLEQLNVITLKENNYTVNRFDEVASKQIFDSISHTHDNLIAVTKKIHYKKSTISFILYYSKAHKLIKVALFAKPVGKVTLSNDGKMAFAGKTRSIIDLSSYKTIQRFSKLELYSVPSKMYFADRSIDHLKFSPKNTYITYIVRYDGTKEDHHVSIIKRIKDKKEFYGHKFVRVSDSGQVYNNISDNEKYTINDGYGASTSWLLKSGSLPIYAIPSKKLVKVINRTKKDLPQPDVAWNNDLLFYTYYSIDKSLGKKMGIYDIKNDKFYCKNMADSVKQSMMQKLIWNPQTNNIYAITGKLVYPFIFKDNKCIPMRSYSHKSDKLRDVTYKTIFVNDQSQITLYSQNKHKTNISHIPLKVFTQKDINILNGVKKAAKMLESGFESRGLKLLDKLAIENYEWNGATVLETDKYRWAYVAYLASKHFNKRLEKSEEINKDFLTNYRSFIGFATWYGYENLIPQVQKKFKEAVRTKKLYNQDEIEQHIAVNEAIYLLSIDKDDEAYDLLFQHQPFTDYTKKYITGVAVCKSSLTKDIAKLAVATDILKDKLKPLECQKYDKHPFFFDINGNKVVKGETPKKSSPKKKVVKTKEENAIELLD